MDNGRDGLKWTGINKYRHLKSQFQSISVHTCPFQSMNSLIIVLKISFEVVVHAKELSNNKH